MNQAAGYMKHQETAEPQYEQQQRNYQERSESHYGLLKPGFTRYITNPSNLRVSYIVPSLTQLSAKGCKTVPLAW
jgi:hypothetical protein